MSHKKIVRHTLRMGVWIAAFSLFVGISIAWLEWDAVGAVPEVLVVDQGGEVDLELIGPTERVRPGEFFTVEVGLQTDLASVVGADVALEYDKTVLEFHGLDLSEHTGREFELISPPLAALEAKNRDRGKLTFSLLERDTRENPSQRQTVLLRFKRLRDQATRIQVMPEETIVATFGSQVSALGKAVSVAIQ